MSTTRQVTRLDQAALSAFRMKPNLYVVTKPSAMVRSTASERTLLRSILIGLDRDNADRRDFLRRRWQNIGMPKTR